MIAVPTQPPSSQLAHSRLASSSGLTFPSSPVRGTSPSASAPSRPMPACRLQRGALPARRDIVQRRRGFRGGGPSAFGGQ